MNCKNICCKRYTRTNFNFCMGCYHQIKNIIGISNEDFIIYINNSFKTKYIFLDDCRFITIYNFLLYKYPNIKSLSNILDSILYIKYLLCDIHLKNKIHFNIYNDYKPINYREYSPFISGTNYFVNKSLSNPEIRLLL